MPKSILIVDDEPAARDALSRVLASRGYIVRTAHDAEEAQHHLGSASADVILLDLDLPHVPGESFATFLHIRYPKTRIIFMSGHYDMINPERFGENSSYFPKPIDIDGLLETLESTQPPAEPQPS